MINGCAAVTSMVHVDECYHQQECVHPYWYGGMSDAMFESLDSDLSSKILLKCKENFYCW